MRTTWEGAAFTFICPICWWFGALHMNHVTWWVMFRSWTYLVPGEERHLPQLLRFHSWCSPWPQDTGPCCITTMRGVKWTGFGSELWHSLSIHCRASYFNSLNVDFLIWKRGVITAISWGCWWTIDLKASAHSKHLVKCFCCRDYLPSGFWQNQQGRGRKMATSSPWVPLSSFKGRNAFCHEWNFLAGASGQSSQWVFPCCTSQIVWATRPSFQPGYAAVTNNPCLLVVYNSTGLFLTYLLVHWGLAGDSYIVIQGPSSLNSDPWISK